MIAFRLRSVLLVRECVNCLISCHSDIYSYTFFFSSVGICICSVFSGAGSVEIVEFVSFKEPSRTVKAVISSSRLKRSFCIVRGKYVTRLQHIDVQFVSHWSLSHILAKNGDGKGRLTPSDLVCVCVMTTSVCSMELANDDSCTITVTVVTAKSDLHYINCFWLEAFESVAAFWNRKYSKVGCEGYETSNIDRVTHTQAYTMCATSNENINRR